MRESAFLRRLGHEPMIVSAFLADLRNDKKWRPEVLRTELISGTPGEAGAEYLETLTWEGLRAPASLEVAELEAGSRLVIVARDPGYKAVYEYTFAGRGQSTELSLLATVETSGPLQLIEPFMWGLIERWLERDLDLLDGVLDEENATPT